MFLPARALVAVIVWAFFSLNGAPQPAPAISITPDELDFAEQPVDSPSQPKDLVLSNQSASAIQLNSILISGIDFSQTNNCDRPIAARASCSVQVVFKPAVSGERLGAIQISWPGASRPRTIPVSGTGSVSSATNTAPKQ